MTRWMSILVSSMLLLAFLFAYPYAVVWLERIHTNLAPLLFVVVAAPFVLAPFILGLRRGMTDSRHHDSGA